MIEQEVQINKEVLDKQEIVVMKFGGSSVANVDRIRHAASIIRDHSQKYKVVVVVSAIQGVTDQLYGVINHIDAGNSFEAITKAVALEQLHRLAIDLLLPDEVGKRPLYQVLDRFRRDILLHAHSPLLNLSDRDFIVSYGERLSPLLISAALNSQGVRSQAIDAAEVVVTNNDYGDAKVHLELSQVKAQAHLGSLISANIVPIMGGFYGISEEGKVAILGRGGSDYSASVLANILNARKLILWKEVDGIFSSDPKKDPYAKFLPEISYDQAELMARNGAKILHPESMVPLRLKNIPIEVRNYFNPQALGSRINGKIDSERR